MIPQAAPEPAARFDSAPVTAASLPPASVTPSAISDLYHGLLATHPMNPAAQQNISQQGAPGGMPPVQATAPNQMSGPQAAPMPQMPPGAMPEAPKRTGMLQRIAGLLGHLGGDESGPYAGLLSGDEKKEGKVSPLWWLLGPGGAMAGRDVARQRLDRILSLKDYATKLQDQQTSRGQAQRIASARASIDQKIVLPPNPSSSDLMDYFRQRESFLLSAGDADGAKQEAENLRAAMGIPRDDKPMLSQPGDEIVDPKTGRVLHATPSASKSYEPKPYVTKDGKSIWVQPGAEIPEGAKPLTQATTEIRVDAGRDKFDQQRVDAGVKGYLAQIKPLRDRAAVIDQALKTIGDAAHNPNPSVRKSLYSSAIANFIQAADQKAQIRWQLLNYYKNNVDASIAGKWEVLKDRLLKGQLPAYSMEGMLTHLSNLRGMLQDEIETQRKGLVTRRADLEGALPLTSEFFPDMDTGGSAPPSSAAASDLYKKYNLTPKKP